MESNTSVLKHISDDDMDMEDGRSIASAETARVTGKRSSRDDASKPSVSGFDMSKASALGRELLERKRLMLGQVALSSSLMRGDGDVTPLAHLAHVKVDDDDASDDGPKQSKKAHLSDSTTPTNESLVKSEPLSEEDIQRRKAQRRREQVRAASRRCRDRQRRETEELRMKVFQLEEFITHTMESYETELRRQRHRLESVQRENESLRSRLASYSDRSPSATASVASSPMSVRSMTSSKADSPGTHRVGSDDIIWDTARIQNMHRTTEDCKRAILEICRSTAPPVIQHHAFGWNFDFWAEAPRYFVRSYKFFPGMRAHDVADRNFDVDFAKYLETFPEIKEKKVLQWPSPNVRIVQTVKDFPGRGAVSSLSAAFISRDECYRGPGERWIVGAVSVGSANTLEFSHEDDCNGHIFEDVIQVASDGTEIHGCMVRGIGRYEGKGRELTVLMEELAKIFASVVIRWEALFINDYMDEANADVDDLDSLDF